MTLFEDIRASLDADRASDTAQALAARGDGLVGELTRGQKEIAQGIGRAWANRNAWPARLRAESEPFADKRVWEFISRATAPKSSQ